MVKTHDVNTFYVAFGFIDDFDPKKGCESVTSTKMLGVFEEKSDAVVLCYDKMILGGVQRKQQTNWENSYNQKFSERTKDQPEKGLDMSAIDRQITKEIGEEPVFEGVDGFRVIELTVADDYDVVGTVVIARGYEP